MEASKMLFIIVLSVGISLPIAHYLFTQELEKDKWVASQFQIDIKNLKWNATEKRYEFYKVEITEYELLVVNTKLGVR